MADKKNICILDTLNRTFLPWWKPFNSFCFVAGLEIVAMKASFIKRRFFVNLLHLHKPIRSSCLAFYIQQKMKNVIMKDIVISLVAVRNQTSNRKCLLELFKRRSKVNQKNMPGMHLKLWPVKINREQGWGFLITKLTRTIVVHDILPNFFKLKRGILLPLTKRVLQLENYLPYQAKIFFELSTSRTYFLQDISYLSLGH